MNIETIKKLEDVFSKLTNHVKAALQPMAQELRDMKASIASVVKHQEDFKAEIKSSDSIFRDEITAIELVAHDATATAKDAKETAEAAVQLWHDHESGWNKKFDSAVQHYADTSSGVIKDVLPHELGHEVKLIGGKSFVIKNGVDGKDGEKGADGINGDNGVDGKDGKDGDNGVGIVAIDLAQADDDVTIAGLLSNGETFSLPFRIKSGIDGEDGRDGIDGIRGIDGVNGVDGSDGKDGRDGIDGKDGRDGVDGKDGSDVVDGFIDRDNNLVLTFANGKAKTLGVVVGRGGEKGKDGHNGADGFDGKDGRDGADGKDGFGLDDLSMEHDGERGFSFVFRSGDLERRFDFRLQVPIYRGVYGAGKAYESGDMVSHFGAVYHFNGGDKAPGIDTSWTLAVANGQRGKTGAKGDNGKPGNDGRDGRDLTKIMPDGSKY